MGRWGYNPQDSDECLDQMCDVNTAVIRAVKDNWKKWAPGRVNLPSRSMNLKLKKNQPYLRRLYDWQSWAIDRAGVLCYLLERGFPVPSRCVRDAIKDIDFALRVYDSIPMREYSWISDCRDPKLAERTLYAWYIALCTRTTYSANHRLMYPSGNWPNIRGYNKSRKICLVSGGKNE